MFINSLPDIITCVCKMHARDTEVDKPINSEQDRLKLQADLNNLEDWAGTWQLCVNEGKCKVLHLGSKNRKCDYGMRCYGSQKWVHFKKSEMEKDIGINVDCELKFARHVEK